MNSSTKWLRASSSLKLRRTSRDAFLAANPPPWDDLTEACYHGPFSDKLDEHLDAAHGSCALRDPRLVRSLPSVMPLANAELYLRSGLSYNSDMSFRFDITKATEVACDLIRREGGVMNIMKLIKLVYALDRLSIQRRGIPVVGGTYFSLPNGPITSELLDLINSGTLWGEDNCRWEEFISDRQNHEIGLSGAEIGTEHLAASELKLIEQIYAELGDKDQWQLRDWSHERCEEWTPLARGRDRIPLAKMARAVGLNDEQIQQIEQDAEELNFVGAALHA